MQYRGAETNESQKLMERGLGRHVFIAGFPKNTPSSAHTNMYTFISHTHTDTHRCTKTQNTHRHTEYTTQYL